MEIQTGKYIIKTFHGLEESLAKEVKELGGRKVEIGNRAVYCMGDLQFAYRSNYLLRTALSVLYPIRTGTVRNEQQLYELLQTVRWDKWFTVDKTFIIEVVSFTDYFKNSHFVALKAKDAVVDQFRSKYRKRPSISKTPDVRINLFIKNDQCTISINTSGDPLFKRGYRMATGHAPINEVLAAGLLKLTGWDPSTPLLDPMCGSGTFLIEAGMMAINIPSQQHRESFGFQKLINFKKDLWTEVKTMADQRLTTETINLRGMDLDQEVIQKARKNAFRSGIRFIKWKTDDFFNWRPKGATGTLIMNPPYDQRMGIDNAIDLYKRLGDHLKNYAPGWKAWIITSHLQAAKQIGLRPSFKKTVFNGALECRFLGFDLFAGKRKHFLASKK